MNLICFADNRMDRSQGKLIESALEHGIDRDKYFSFKPSDINRWFFETNKEIFDQERGYGYWLWKPYFIYEVMQHVGENEIIFYCDSGMEIINNLKYVELNMGEDIFLFSGRFKHAEWCKMDVVRYINHHSMNYVDTHSGPMYSMNGYESFTQIQASNMFFRNTKRAREFVKEWLLLCQMPGFIDDSPSKETNFPSFAEHRHDQAILTCLQIKYGIPLHWFPSTTNMDRQSDFNDKYPPLFEHHRKRNDQW